MSSRIKNKIVREKLATQNPSQVVKKAVQMKIGSRRSPRTSAPQFRPQQCENGDEDANITGASFENTKNGQDSESKSRKFEKWNYKLNRSKNMITFGGIRFSISKKHKKEVVCKSCNETLTYGKAIMRTHVIQKHTNRFACSKCPYKGYCKSRFEGHIRTIHDGILEQCTECGKFYKSLKYHMKYQHGNTERFYCKEKGCRQSFKIHANLKKHTKAVHRKQKPWKCTVCSREFAWKGPFKEHMNLHNGIRKWKCEVDGCGAAFARNYSLKKHHRCYHEEGSKPGRKSYQKGTIVKN